MPNSDFSCVETRFFFGSRQCAGVFQTQVPKLCTDLDSRLLYILILGTFSKFARKINFLQPCARRPRHRAALLWIVRIFLSCWSQGWVKLTKRIGEVDRRRFAWTCGNRNETLKYPGRFHRDTERYFRKIGTIFEKNHFRKIWSIISRLYIYQNFRHVFKYTIHWYRSGSIGRAMLQRLWIRVSILLGFTYTGS